MLSNEKRLAIEKPKQTTNYIVQLRWIFVHKNIVRFRLKREYMKICSKKIKSECVMDR